MRSNKTYIIALVILLFAVSAAAQDRIWKPTIPFDFSIGYYKLNGIIPDNILSRRNGQDGVSVFDKAPSPMFANVRVLATVPAYDQAGNMMFWFPLGDLRNDSFTPDKIGYITREKAREFPMYIFPDPNLDGFTAFTGHRQAPVIDQWGYSGSANPLGIRMMYSVYYTEKARGKEGWEMMQFMGKKNGWSADGTAIIKSVDDIRYLDKGGYLAIKPVWAEDMHDLGAGFTLAPIFENPTGGAIYPDALLLMTMKNGKPLPAEDIFSREFACLQKMGGFCDSDSVLAF